MKRLYIRSVLLAVTVCMLNISCQKKLVEKPYTVFTVDYFKTPSGLQNGVNALYSGLRSVYGNIGGMYVLNAGTDEWTYGDQVQGGSELELASYAVSSTNGHILTIWNNNYANINLANALIQFAPDVEMDANAKTVILGEAHFLRAYFYFLLVQQFGAVPLDLGGGELQFNETPYQGFNRLPTDQLFIKNYQAIIDDFIFASQNLPDARPAGAFKLSKGAALHLLAKAYIYRAYSAAKQSTDFKNAWDAAKKLIDNPAQYGTGLLTNFADVNKEGNEYNQEILLSVERIPGNPIDNEVVNIGSDFSNKANISLNLFNCNYQNNVAIPAGSGKFPCDRVIQYSRPLRQLVPTPYVYNIVFADKLNDSRYNNSFRTMWRATNTNVAGINIGDTAYYLASSDAEGDAIIARGVPYRVIKPSEFYLPSRPGIQMFPALTKYDDNKRQAPNDGSGRPFPIAKLSESYLLAAEAAIGDNRPADALPLVLTIRQRAAFRANLSPAELLDRQNRMKQKNTGTLPAPVWVDLASGDMTLDFILDERTRELCGESIRWPDLACRNKLVDRVRLYNLAAAAKVLPKHNLRPIPQTQLDAINDPDKQQYQNPGY
ncbi:RagB/SusD family nutrient uptake outer membrane protein [Chitinophaga sp. GbtcB8]|uniref:RagB/SusD family nutrient uptake outer membrane protein n=1 Tax=Chitinophaga sp. GbtcB8 TaxID=2824753 RepID=UPI001C30E92A|nr:RagB/SusD family nutrient uptake outer membrane protein [Chitinophaga sp. GbtcB8]